MSEYNAALLAIGVLWLVIAWGLVVGSWKLREDRSARIAKSAEMGLMMVGGGFLGWGSRGLPGWQAVLLFIGIMGATLVVALVLKVLVESLIRSNRI